MKRNTEGEIINANAEDVAGAVLASNRELITEMFEWMHIKQGEPPLFFTKQQRSFAAHMLSSAAVAAELGVLSEDTAKIIIGRLASLINCFHVIRYLRLCGKTIQDEGPNGNNAALNLVIAILTDAPREDVEAKVKDLPSEEFKFFLGIIAQEDITTMDEVYNSSIFTRIYEEGMIKSQTFFAFMNGCLATPPSPTELLSALESLPDVRGFIVSLGEDGDEDEPDEEPDGPEEDHGNGNCGNCCGECHGECGCCDESE